MITQALLKELFTYEAETGLLRRISGGRKLYPWRGAGEDRKYLLTQIRAEPIYLHQAVWLYHYGWLPKYIDHRDRDTKNCRIENLRPATNAQNQYNSTIKRTNQCGFKGVRLHIRGGRKPYQAKIVFEGKQISLGYYATPGEAGAAYAAALPKYAGEYGRVR